MQSPGASPDVLARPANRPDLRSSAERRSGRKRYGKAHAYYGKTYIITKKQLRWALVAWLGTALASGALMFMGYVWVYAQAASN